MVSAYSTVIFFLMGCGMSNAGTTAEILQLFVDLPALQQYYHVESRGDAPVTVICSDPRCAGIKLKKFDQAVVIKPDLSDIGDAPHIEITSFEQSADTARIEFSYDTQGVGGVAEFVKSGENWTVKTSEAWEE
jgi:hypothetical protein